MAGRHGWPLVIAVDGGNSKTDAALVDASGRYLGVARGPGSNRDDIGLDGTIKVLDSLLRSAWADAGLDPADGPLPAAGVFCLAGVDLAVHERQLAKALRARDWAGDVVVRNDTFAVLRAGTDRGWGVAVVCGAGDNCLGVSPSGRVARFASLGPISGDLGGGKGIGLAALGAAVRGRDGRGGRTALERLVPAHFGFKRPGDVATAIAAGQLEFDRLVELPPVVFSAADAGDAVAAQIVDRLADEAATLARACLRRLRMLRREVDVVLGGGLFRSGYAPLLERVRAGVLAAAPLAEVNVLFDPPVVGSVVLGLEHVGASPPARRRARTDLPRF